MSSESNALPLLEVISLCVDYLGVEQDVRACDDVNFTLRRGEILGIAGESASGKSTLLNAITRLQNPPAVTSCGRVVYHPLNGASPVDLVTAKPEQLRRFRWSDISIVMQSAMACLNPVLRLSEQFIDVIRTHEPKVSRKDAGQRAVELLRMVGIASGALDRYAHELSGGMRQRALIALAMACDPDLIVMDEPTTAVDVVMQRQILTQILKLQRERGFAVIFVTHDLSLLLELADRIAVMYGGRIVEVADGGQIAKDPKHPYTSGLRDSFPSLLGPKQRIFGIPGSPPDLRKLPGGCSFSPRCPMAREACTRIDPELETHDGASVACLARTTDAAAAAEYAGSRPLENASLGGHKGHNESAGSTPAMAGSGND